VTTATRLELLPDIPPVGDFVPGYEASAWIGFGAPKNTPAAIVDRYYKEVNLAISDFAIKARLVDFGALVLPGSPTDFGKLIADDTEKWTRVIIGLQASSQSKRIGLVESLWGQRRGDGRTPKRVIIPETRR
jgi:tripartite-type tricarboxylate transporter receptor subunit TctC